MSRVPEVVVAGLLGVLALGLAAAVVEVAIGAVRSREPIGVDAWLLRRVTAKWAANRWNRVRWTGAIPDGLLGSERVGRAVVAELGLSEACRQSRILWILIWLAAALAAAAQSILGQGPRRDVPTLLVGIAVLGAMHYAVGLVKNSTVRGRGDVLRRCMYVLEACDEVEQGRMAVRDIDVRIGRLVRQINNFALDWRFSQGLGRPHRRRIASQFRQIGAYLRECHAFGLKGSAGRDRIVSRVATVIQAFATEDYHLPVPDYVPVQWFRRAETRSLLTSLGATLILGSVALPFLYFFGKALGLPAASIGLTGLLVLYPLLDRLGVPVTLLWSVVYGYARKIGPDHRAGSQPQESIDEADLVRNGASS
jgi:hypothetical protein